MVITTVDEMDQVLTLRDETGDTAKADSNEIYTKVAVRKSDRLGNHKGGGIIDLDETKAGGGLGHRAFSQVSGSTMDSYLKL